MLKKHTTKIIAGIIIIISLITAFFADSEEPHNQRFDEVMSEETIKEPEQKPEEIEQPSKKAPALDEKEREQPKEKEETVKQKEPEPVVEELSEPDKKEELTCTLSVRCDTILKNLSSLNVEKTDIVPKDGVIFAEKTVAFSEGESVFDILEREMRDNNIHFEFVKTPGYNSAYVEAIGNLYEFDCGELSGWMCKVNGRFLNCGPSNYMLKDEDRIEWVYTCDLGKDVGE